MESGITGACDRDHAAWTRRSYEACAAAATENPAARKLLAIVARKKTNLCVSADLASASEILALADAVGPHICLLKTHCDIVSDFSTDFTAALTRLAAQHDFMIFEDRKFADIGATVAKQYAGGIHRIVEWAHIVDAHVVAGTPPISALRDVARECAVKMERGLLLIASMSSAGTMLQDSGGRGPTETAAGEIAAALPDYVAGYIAQTRPFNARPDAIVLTPGINLDVRGDSLGQRYRSPEAVFKAARCDIMIVGRGICACVGAAAQRDAAKRYQAAGWDAYLADLGEENSNK